MSASETGGSVERVRSALLAAGHAIVQHNLRHVVVYISLKLSVVTRRKFLILRDIH